MSFIEDILLKEWRWTGKAEGETSHRTIEFYKENKSHTALTLVQDTKYTEWAKAIVFTNIIVLLLLFGLYDVISHDKALLNGVPSF